MQKNKTEILKKVFPEISNHRLKQFEKALLEPKSSDWTDVESLPSAIRQSCAEQIPWYSFINSLVLTSQAKDTYKAALELTDKQKIETVLMKNSRGWSICVSSQVGCAMRCGFCATGTMGFKRNLTSDEILDQYRFWQKYILQNNLPGPITNVVFMGMGEPLANYEAVKAAINLWLRNDHLGRTHITVSTSGTMPVLKKLLEDPEWPLVRLTLSLHSADVQTRKTIMPISYDNFLNDFRDWAKKYLTKLGKHRHLLSLEYVMLKEINDSSDDAKKLLEYVNSIDKLLINLIPYNQTFGQFQSSSPETIRTFANYLLNNGLRVTIRKTMGDDISAACGQLVVKTSK